MPRSSPPLTQRDRELLEFLALHRSALAMQAAALLGVTEPTARVRARRLADRGLIRRQQVFKDQSESLWITARGLRAIESELTAPVFSQVEFRHDVGMAWLWLAARSGAFGRLTATVSEREMQRQDGLDGNAVSRYGIGLATSSGRGPKSDRHFPDLTLRTASGHRIAVELELSAKGWNRMRQIMLAYSVDRRYDRVLYLVQDRRIGELVASAARNAGVSDMVKVQMVSASVTAGVGNAVAPERRRNVQQQQSRTIAARAGIER